MSHQPQGPGKGRFGHRRPTGANADSRLREAELRAEEAETRRLELEAELRIATRHLRAQEAEELQSVTAELQAALREARGIAADRKREGVDAEGVGREVAKILRAAQEYADQIVREAHAAADRRVAEADHRLAEAERRWQQLRSASADFSEWRESLRSSLEELNRRVDQMRARVGELPGRLPPGLDPLVEGMASGAVGSEAGDRPKQDAPRSGLAPSAPARPDPKDQLRQEFRRALVDSGVAGVVSHPMDNVLWKIGLLCDGDRRSQFGLTGISGLSPEQVLAIVGRAAGFEPDPGIGWGPVLVDPELVLRACDAVGDRLALACRNGERVVLATGHPTGLIQLYTEVGRELAARGAIVLRPAQGAAWREGHRHREIRYFSHVAVLSDRTTALHTHSAVPMQVVLEAERPDVVFADHGWAGAAIEAGVDTVSIADVNDPALIVAKDLGRTEAVIVMDDNVRPDAYWPCFQAIVSRLP